VQILREVREGSSEDTCLRLRRVPVRFRRVPVQMPCEVPEGSGADTLSGSRAFQYRL